MPEPEVLLKPREAAAALGISYATIKQWILAGKLKSIQTPGGHHRIPQSSISKMTKDSEKTDAASSKEKRISSRERFRSVSGRNQLVGTIVDVKISGLMAQGRAFDRRSAHHVDHHRRCCP